MDAADPGRGDARSEDRPPLATRWPLAGTLAVSLASFAAAAAVSIALAIAIGIVRRAAEARTPEEILVLTLGSDAALLLVLFFLARRLLGAGPRELGLLAPPTRTQLTFALFAAAGLWVASIAVNAIQIALFGPNPQALVVSVGGHQGLRALALDLAAAAVIAPVAEELLYRGVLFRGLLRYMPFALAAAVSGVLFAVSHGLGVLMPITVLGFGLAWVYWRTRTLWAPIVAHAAVNAISLAIVFAAPRHLLGG